MRNLIAMAMIGASAVIFSASAPAQAMTAGSAGVAKSAAAPAESTVHEVRRRWKHRHYRKWRHRHYGYRHHRHYRHRYYGSPYYYGGGYYPYRYYRRPGVGLYFRF